jgi:hypothetical protein
MLTRLGDLGLPFASWTLHWLTAYLSESKVAVMRCSYVGEALRRKGLEWRQEETRFSAWVGPNTTLPHARLDACRAMAWVGGHLARSAHVCWGRKATWRSSANLAHERGQSSGSTPPRLQAVLSSALAEWAREPVRATSAASSGGQTRPRRREPSRRPTKAGKGRAVA